MTHKQEKRIRRKEREREYSSAESSRILTFLHLTSSWNPVFKNSTEVEKGSWFFSFFSIDSGGVMSSNNIFFVTLVARLGRVMGFRSDQRLLLPPSSDFSEDLSYDFSPFSLSLSLSLSLRGVPRLPSILLEVADT